jgi:hypothetical protein
MAHEHYSGRKHPEFVVLEIGDEIGALIVNTGAEMHGAEVEISPAGSDEKRSHKEVLERVGGEGSAYTAVFDKLPAGSYTLWTEGVAREREVLVSGGEISHLDWR